MMGRLFALLAWVTLALVGPVAHAQSDPIARGLAVQAKALATPVTYMGNVATRSNVPNATIGTTGRQMMTRSLHFARDNLAAGCRIGIPNWYVSTGGVETGTGAPTQVHVAIENAAGAIIAEVKWNGSATGSVADLTTGWSDPLTALSIPRGSKFFIRVYRSSTVGLAYLSGGVNTVGDGFESGASGISDKVLSGTVTAATGGILFAPYFVCPTQVATIGIIGDSKAVGALDTSDNNADVGILARSIGATNGYINTARTGDTMQAYVGSHARRAELMSYVSHILFEYGINDFAAGRTSAQMAANLSAIIGYFPDKPIWVTTITPKTTSSDSFATTANQTVTANENNRSTYNDALRSGTLAGVSGQIAGIIDIDRIVADPVAAAKWVVGYTVDGTHENTRASIAVQSSKVVPTFR